MPSKQIEFEKSGNNYAYHQEWLDEAKLTRLLTCENEGRPFFFAVHGAMVIEKGAKLIKQVFYHPSEVVSDTDKLTGCHPYINKNGICHFAWENSYSAASLDALRLASRYDFSLSEYAQAVDISLNKLYQKNDVKFAVGESVGSLVLMDAVAQRIKNGQKVPETLFLINFAVGGLCP